MIRTALLLLILTFSSCNRMRARLPIFTEENGKIKITYLSNARGIRHYGKTINLIQKRAISHLDQKYQHSPWQIRRFMIGLGLGTEFGIGVASMEIKSFVELRISKM